jgi:hypothetical protein
VTDPKVWIREALQRATVSVNIEVLYWKIGGEILDR